MASPITINGNSLNPSAPGIRAFGLESDDAASSNYILIQTDGPLRKAQKEDLKAKDVAIHEYVSENTYLCGYKPEDLAPIRELPFVKYANVYQQTFVVQPDLRTQQLSPTESLLNQATTHSRTLQTVDVIFHHDIDPDSCEIRSELATAARADPDDITLTSKKAQLSVQEQYLDDIAAIDGVCFIKAVHAKKLRNNIARGILNADVIINDTPYKGEGQVVCVGDTGFDTGDTENPHPAFTGRVKKLYALGRPNKSDDPDGHGTHVCGSVLGDGISKTMGVSPEFKIEAPASKATLVVQSLLDRNNGLGGIPNDLEDLFRTPYEKDGARIHTNSWGSGGNSQLPYDGSSIDIDKFVYEHPDMVILFAAGNDGKDADNNGIIDRAQIGSEAASKNCITVGATENDRPDIATTYGQFGYSAQPLFSDKISTSSEGMAAFSSRGPTKEKRIKPDVVAPGTGILSTRSRRTGEASPIYGVSKDKEWMFLAGTSMATPLVAGCCAVIRETLVKNGTEKPSAALIKALLINGADDVEGQYVPSEAGPSPNINSGFGLVNVAGSVILPGDANGGFGDSEKPLDDEEEFEFTIDVPSSDSTTQINGTSTSPKATPTNKTLKVTLVWSDPPAAALQSDLDLTVIAGGKERHGNMGTKKTFDRINNVERVFWVNVPAGEVKVKVSAYRITTTPQHFAWAWKLY
ncbi:peptidase S8 and S53 [Patellaria atrata CBS 101060]|uniref:Peptidase S8 and S53 n=1 Tax=Patellaria atrata CBS 101060 TaxID=1346257 RepID=A0A9P4SIA7_9PEZI|nr:peptidase S8 and S53 [Patellaria atrata CBS 101060]